MWIVFRILAIVGLLFFIVCGHELIRVSGPGNIGGNSIRYIYMLAILANVYPIIILCLFVIRSRRFLLGYLWIALLNLGYILFSLFRARTYYLDIDRYNLESNFSDIHPPPIGNYGIAVVANVIIVLVLLFRVRKLKLGTNH